MRHVKVIAVAGLAALALSACGSASRASESDTITEVVRIYDGSPLHCVALGSGLSCDWVRYHAEKH